MVAPFCSDLYFAIFKLYFASLTWLYLALDMGFPKLEIPKHANIFQSFICMPLLQFSFLHLYALALAVCAKDCYMLICRSGFYWMLRIFDCGPDPCLYPWIDSMVSSLLLNAACCNSGLAWPKWRISHVRVAERIISQVLLCQFGSYIILVKYPAFARNLKFFAARTMLSFGILGIQMYWYDYSF